MDTPTLQQATLALEQQLEKARMDRNYLQHERVRVRLCSCRLTRCFLKDTTESFYQLTREELRQNENQLLEKDREIQLMESNHNVQVRVYLQKVKHLEKEHENTLKKLLHDGIGRSEDQADVNIHREKAFRHNKQMRQEELQEKESTQQEQVQMMKQTQEKNLDKIRQQFEAWNESVARRGKDQLLKLKEMLLLRRKVDIHEIEERKNTHINDLMRNHEKAFIQIRSYYNDITKDNLELISSLKNEIQTMKVKAEENSKLMQDVALENKRLSEPLTIAIREVEHLRAELKDEQKDRLSLLNAKARLQQVKLRIADIQLRQNETKNEFGKLQSDRSELYDTFERMVRKVYEEGEWKTNGLESQINGMETQCTRNENQMEEILSHTKPLHATFVKESVQIALKTENDAIDTHTREIAKKVKEYNDSVRICTKKMRQLGIPEEDLGLEDFSLLSPLKRK
ncbi:hypothetical protein ABG067_003641 [Albugo candida]